MSKVTQNTWKNIRRMPYQAIAAISVLTVTFFIAQVFTLVTLGSKQILNYFETRPQISAYFTDDTAETDILAQKKSLETKPYIKAVSYISKDKALEIYRQQNQDDQLLLEMVTADILPASLEVSPASIEDLPQIQQDLKNLTGIEEVVYQQDVVEALTNWTRGIKQAGIGLIAFLTATSILIVIIIIGMKVAARRQEITIMKLVGANRWFIIGPFLYEGAIYGFLGALLSWGLAYTLLLYATPTLVNFLGDIPLLPVDVLVMLLILGITGVMGLIIGMLGGIVAVRRYFKK